jgi:dipeptidyl aminopeptidase/acylaminoacyl peptidase
MPFPNGHLLNRTPVILSKYQRNTVQRLYDSSIDEKSRVDRIVYASDGLKVAGYIAQPAEAGTYPVLIWNRGGFGKRGALDDLTAYLILASTAVWGCVVLATQYRGNMGGEGEEDWGDKDINDAWHLLDVAADIPECDMSRIAVEGASRGGMTTYRLLARSSRFRCAIVHAGLSDIFALREQKEEFARFIRKRFGSLTEIEREQELIRRSAVRFADRFSRETPILLLHGTRDNIVPLEQSELMTAVLEEERIPHEFKIIENGGHVALKDGSYREIDGYRKAWLSKYLFPKHPV